MVTKMEPEKEAFENNNWQWVEIPKKETAPKSERVSIATKDNPATIAGLDAGKIIFKNVFLFEKPRFLPSSSKFCDW